MAISLEETLREEWPNNPSTKVSVLAAFLDYFRAALSLLSLLANLSLDVLTPLDKPVDTLTDLTPAELTNMKEWQSHFSAKYPVVGELVDNGEA